jgi:uncharacterized lipoprotein YajG
MKSFTNKYITMKKLLLVLAIGSFAACNGSASTETKADSAATKDSAAAIVDSAKAKIDSVTTTAKDSLKAKVDSAVKK